MAVTTADLNSRTKLKTTLSSAVLWLRISVSPSFKVAYPEIAVKVAHAVADGKCDRGILVCGTGIGMSIAANKVKGIRAAVCSDHFSAKYTRLHNDANILCMGGRVVGPGVGVELADLFVDTEYEGGRHAKRVAMIADIEEGKM